MAAAERGAVRQPGPTGGGGGKRARGWVCTAGEPAGPRRLCEGNSDRGEQQTVGEVVGVKTEALTGWHCGEGSCAVRWPQAC